MAVVEEQIVKPYHQTDRFSLYEGDCRSVLLTLEDNSVDSIVCDPPYGLEFMGKDWDAPWKYGITKFGFADNKFRKPAPQFQSSRNPMCRTCRKHKRGSKSHEKCACESPDYDETEHRLSDMAKLQEWCYSWAIECLRVLKPGGHLLAFGGSRTYHRLACAIEDAGFEIRDQIQWLYGSGFPKSLDVSKAIDAAAGAEREVVGEKIRGDVQAAKVNGVTMAAAAANRNNEAIFGYGVEKLTLPATDAAKQWSGWGTALKPAHEPIVLARKPLIGTVAENVLKHGTGGLNIDGCRIEGNMGPDRSLGKPRRNTDKYGEANALLNPQSPLGRFPANVIHDGSEEVLAAFPDAPGQQRALIGNEPSGAFSTWSEGLLIRNAFEPRGDSGSAARFFYCAKATQEDRNEGLNGSRNGHPTVKPISLARYLCRLVTPPDGTVLDPFAGSGSLGIGALLEGFRFVGIEKEAEYCQIAKSRLEYWEAHYQPELFRRDGMPNLPICDTTDKEQLSLLTDLLNPDRATT